MKQWYKKGSILFLILTFLLTTGLSCSRGGTREANPEVSDVGAGRERYQRSAHSVRSCARRVARDQRTDPRS